MFYTSPGSTERTVMKSGHLFGTLCPSHILNVAALWVEQESCYCFKLCFKVSCTISDIVRYHFGLAHIEGRLSVKL